MTGKDEQIVTRFAPSPTGFLHIGGARTAFFNWLHARHHGGRFLLRIEDTDRARSTPEATEAIFQGLRWLGLDWDGEAVSQFARADRHRAVANELLASGNAYRCYSSKEDIDAFRDAARAEGRTPIFRSPWRDSTETKPSLPYVVRLRAPQEGQTVIEDAVQGNVTFQNDTLDDLILLRSNGTPTYMFAVVVDDHDMGVTQIIRGDDHLTNAARQSVIYHALGWTVPGMAHVPLIHGADGAKLSKRHGALGVEAYRDLGYPPEAILNYLARLGWSHGDDEFFTVEQAIAWFELDQVGRAASRFDIKKLEHLSGQHIRTSEPARLVRQMRELLALQQKPEIDAGRQELLLHAMPGLQERAKTILEIIDMSHYILGERPFEPDKKSAKHLTEDTRAMLARLTERLQNASWSANELEIEAKAFAEAEGLKLGKVAQPLRVALTGRSVSPSVFDVLVTLGRDESLARLGDNISS